MAVSEVSLDELPKAGIGQRVFLAAPEGWSETQAWTAESRSCRSAITVTGWRRHDMPMMKTRLKAKVAQDGIVLTESQLAALEKVKVDNETHESSRATARATAAPKTPFASATGRAWAGSIPSPSRRCLHRREGADLHRNLFERSYEVSALARFVPPSGRVIRT